MSRYNRFLWIVVGVLAVVMIAQFFFTNRKPPYDQTYYYSEYIFSATSTVNVHSIARFDFHNTADLKKAEDQFKGLSQEDKMKSYRDMFANLSKSTKIPITVVSYHSTMTSVDSNTLQIDERSSINGILTLGATGNRISMGGVTMKLDQNSEVIFRLPQGSKVLSVAPTPTSADGATLTWKGPQELKFPEVTYKK